MASKHLFNRGTRSRTIVESTVIYRHSDWLGTYVLIVESIIRLFRCYRINNNVSNEHIHKVVGIVKFYFIGYKEHRD